MPRNARWIFVGVAAVALISIAAAAPQGSPTLGDLLRRVEALEKRVAAIEKRISVDMPKEGAGTTKEAPAIEIAVPKSDASVGMKAEVIVIVRARLDGTEPVLLVRPIHSSQYWPQYGPLSPTPTDDGLRFVFSAQFGTEDVGRGEKFAIYAVLAKKGTLKPGDSPLDSLPEGIPRSEPVFVTRSND